MTSKVSFSFIIVGQCLRYLFSATNVKMFNPNHSHVVCVLFYNHHCLQPCTPTPALSALGSALLTHRAEEAPGVCHHSQEVFEVHVTISCGGQKNTEWTGAFQSRLGHCNPGTAVSIYLLELIIKVTHS